MKQFLSCLFFIFSLLLTARAQNNGEQDSISIRMAARNFPSVFIAWNIAENLRQQPNDSVVPLSSIEKIGRTISRHDLYFNTWAFLGLRLAGGQKYPLLSPVFTPESIQLARQRRAALLAMNPNMVILAAVQYYAAQQDYLPPESPWWNHGQLDDQVQRNNVDYRAYRLDFSIPAFQDSVAALCAAIMKTGVYDGIMFDWWHDDGEMANARLELIKKVRVAIGEKAIIIGNANNHLPKLTAPYLNGMFMEGLNSTYFPDWRTAADNLIWGESHLRKPAITALEQWWSNGRGDYNLMREVTTLSLVFSNGYVLFSDPNPLPTGDHLHDWYGFWDKSLGKPTGPLADLHKPDLSGAYTRQYEKGEVVFNPPNNHPVTVQFDQPRRSAANGATGTSFTVAPGDGDLFLIQP